MISVGLEEARRRRCGLAREPGDHGWPGQAGPWRRL